MRSKWELFHLYIQWVNQCLFFIQIICIINQYISSTGESGVELWDWSTVTSCCTLALWPAATPERRQLPAPSPRRSRSVFWHSGSPFPERLGLKVDDCSCPTTWWISQECICRFHSNSNTYQGARWRRHQKSPLVDRHWELHFSSFVAFLWPAYLEQAGVGVSGVSLCPGEVSHQPEELDLFSKPLLGTSQRPLQPKDAYMQCLERTSARASRSGWDQESCLQHHGRWLQGNPFLNWFRCCLLSLRSLRHEVYHPHPGPSASDSQRWWCSSPGQLWGKIKKKQRKKYQGA